MRITSLRPSHVAALAAMALLAASPIPLAAQSDEEFENFLVKTIPYWE